MYSRLVSWSRRLYLAGIVLALVLVIPTAWFPFQLSKVGVFAAFLFIAAALYVLGGGMREALRSHGFYAVLLVGLLPLAYVLSALFSVDHTVAWSGFGVETDTVLFTTLLFLACTLSFMLFRTLRTVRMLTMVVFWALIAATIFQVISIVFGSAAIPFSTFADRSVNLVGKWNDLGLLVGLLGLLFLARVELMNASNLFKAVVSVICAAIVVLLGIINFSLVWAMILFFSLALGTVKFLMQRVDATDGAPAHWLTKLPWFAIAGIVVSVLFLFFGSTFNLGLTNLFPVSSLEVRPSYSSTLDVINAARGGSFERVLIGTGPNTFGEQWLAFKPSAVNQSAFWNLDFNVGFSTLVTALGTVGLLGALAWLIPILLVLVGLLRAVRSAVLNREDKVVATTLGITTLFLLGTVLFYVPSQNIVVLAFVLTGATFGFLWRQGRSSVEPAESPASRFSMIGAFAAIIIFVLLAAWSSFTIDRRLVAEAYAGRGASSLQAGNADSALADAATSQKVEGTADGLNLQLQASITKLQAIAASSSASTPALQQQFAAVVQSAITAGQASQKEYPQDYRSTLLLAQLYDYLSSLNVQGAASTAAQTYLNAAAQDPTNPAIPLAIARLAATAGDQANTTKYLSEALTLKPNYTDAILLVVQLDVANKDIPSAIKAATAAAQTAPGVAPIWFELGLLYYSNGDATNAAQALEQAVAIQSDYANAQYFLGLSYYALGRTPDAIKEFQALAVSNPDNTEVQLILSNLTSGKKPFDGAQPPVTPTPQTRATAPISQ